ncbi:MAG: amino acid adenylation domain-containing protein, partial [bacterium]|nr:amino acid adenylation domain-containing protein [bacterium]
MTGSRRKRISEIEIISEEEKRRLLVEFNDTTAEYPGGKTIQRLFEEQVKRTPGSTAVSGVTLSSLPVLEYRELNEKAAQTAGILWKEGIRPGSIVGIMTDASVEMITAIMAVLKSGGAYLPIDPAYPDERIRYMLADSGAGILLTARDFSGRIAFDKTVLYIEDLLDDGFNEPVNHCLEPAAVSSDIAYVIYTSGSTGKPKGVMIEHDGISNLRYFHKERFKVNETDRIIQFAGSSFDASVWEICMALLNGAALYLPEREVIGNYGLFEEYIAGNGITIATLPPSYANNLNPDKLKSLRILITAGSAPTFALVDKWVTNLEYINAYGPTETTICATVWKAEEKSTASNAGVVPIGSPIDNTYVYILDGNLNIQPLGVPGELCISGAGLARGYLNRPELTAEKFGRGAASLSTPLPLYPSIPPFYRTGDLARWLPDGNIEFLGRIDQQVKIRGYRVELGEIESQLLKHPGIKEAVVIDRVGEDAEKYLCAYIVLDGEDITGLKEYLSEELPGYMIPLFFVPVEEIPLTANGKVDRKALPVPEAAPAGVEYAPAVTRIEQALVGIWSKVLGVGPDKLGIDANFFELGGHSLKGTVVTSRIHKQLNVTISLSEIFKFPTIRQLAIYIEGASEDKYRALEPAGKLEFYTLSSAQKRLYILAQMDYDSIGYNIPYMYGMDKDTDLERLENAFRGLIKRHESFRTSFVMVNNEPVQRIHNHVPSKIVGTEHCSVRTAAINNFVRPFDLAEAPLIRMGLIEEGE